MTKRKKVWATIAVVIVVGIGSYAIIIGRHLTYLPKNSSIKLRDGKINTGCLVNNDCRLVYENTDYTKCSQYSICGGGNVAVNNRIFNKMGSDLGYLTSRDVSSDVSCPNGIGLGDNTNPTYLGCPLGMYQKLKPVCYFFRCGIYDVGK